MNPVPFPCGALIRPEGHHDHSWAGLTSESRITVNHGGAVSNHASMSTDQFRRDSRLDNKPVPNELTFVDVVDWCGDCGLVATTQTTRTTTATSVLFQQETTYRVVGPHPDAGRHAAQRTVCPPCVKKAKP